MKGLDVGLFSGITAFCELFVRTNFGIRSSLWKFCVDAPLSYDSIYAMEIYCGPFNVGVCNFIKCANPLFLLALSSNLM